MTILYAVVIMLCIGIVILSGLAGTRRSELHAEIQRELDIRNRLILDIERQAEHSHPQVDLVVYEIRHIERSPERRSQPVARIKSVHQWASSPFQGKGVARWAESTNSLKDAAPNQEDDEYYHYLSDAAATNGSTMIH